jgi:hypothetical protein
VSSHTTSTDTSTDVIRLRDSEFCLVATQRVFLSYAGFSFVCGYGCNYCLVTKLMASGISYATLWA